MNKRQSIFVLSAAVALGLPALASAETYVGNTTIRDTKALRTQVSSEIADNVARGLSADGLFRWVGGEVLWQPIPHTYLLRNGQLQHVEYAPLDTPPRPSARTESVDPQDREFYLG